MSSVFCCSDDVKPRWRGVYGLDPDAPRIVAVIASTISPSTITYLCPICNRTHRHGSSQELHNRTESRVAHCLMVCHDVNIHITDATVRVPQARWTLDPLLVL